ncbi:unnamed protein product [Effrenium voratum]|nr:unnamed protein product [Effrenium voratum]
MIGLKWGVDRDALGMAETGEARLRVIDMKAVVAEFIAMTLFVVIGCGAACANGAGDSSARTLVALAFGMGILVLAYSVGHHSGGQINCAVTWSLVVGGQVPWYQGLANLIAQLLGSLSGAGLLCALFPFDQDKTGSLGSNVINDSYGVGNVLVGEFLGTFILCFVVWETAVSPAASCGKNACIAIGFAVFLAHVLLLPVDGCSINPTRWALQHMTSTKGGEAEDALRRFCTSSPEAEVPLWAVIRLGRKRMKPDQVPEATQEMKRKVASATQKMHEQACQQLEAILAAEEDASLVPLEVLSAIDMNPDAETRAVFKDMLGKVPEKISEMIKKWGCPLWAFDCMPSAKKHSGQQPEQGRSS